jgi:hypothetical protein
MVITTDAWLVDTNILVQLAHRPDPLRTVAWQAVRSLWERGGQHCYTSLILGDPYQGSGLSASSQATSARSLGLAAARLF